MGAVPPELKRSNANLPGRRRSHTWELLRRLPSLCASAAAHGVVLLVLSLFVAIQGPLSVRHDISVDLTTTKTSDLMDDLLAKIRDARQPVDVTPTETEAPEEDPVPPAPDPEQDAPSPGKDTVPSEVPSLVPLNKLAIDGGRKGDIVGNRSGGSKQAAMARYGATEASESAVKAALRWLMRHQDLDGKWSCRDFRVRCARESNCGGAGEIEDSDVGLTALSLLAFLSGSSHPADGTDFGRVVGRGASYLVAVQEKSGRFGGPSGHEMYNQSLAVLALAEAYILSDDKTMLQPLQAGVKYLVEAQQPEGGWDYTSARTGRNDSSVTGFVVMALKSASAAGIEIPWMTTYGLIEHFDRMTRDTGEMIYANKGTGAGRGGPGMVAVGAVARQFLGWPVDSPVLQRQYDFLRRNLPQWELLPEDSLHSLYYWYYGTLAMFQAGGDNWSLWNAALRDMLVRRQRQDGCARGSWDPVDRWLGRAAGRVYATAINAMNLQVYYRYLPVYGSPSLNSFEALTRAAKLQGDMRIRAIRILREFQGEQPREFLVTSLADPDPFVQLNAARSLLAQRENDAAVPVLKVLSRSPNGFIRASALEELLRFNTPDLVPVMVERLSDSQEFIATKAAEKLRRICRENVPFDFSNEEQKSKAIAFWRDWWMKYSAGQVKIDTSVLLGNVIVTKPNENIVMIDIGKRDAVRTGDEFDVIREGRVVARVRVHRVIDQYSATRVCSTDQAGAVRQGDIVQRVKTSN